MADLDPLVAEVLLKGDDDLLRALQRIGTEGHENFSKLVDAVKEGASPLSQFSNLLTSTEAIISGVTAAVVVFIEAQTELSQKTVLLAEAFGTTAGQLQSLEATFASSGVKVDQFERFANRLTITIAREWPQISESIKNYATQNDAATLRVTNAILRIRDAQNAVSDNSQERASRAQHDNDAIASSFLKLQNAAQHAADEQRGAYLSVQNAALSVTAAEQHLAELQGRPPSAADKEALAISQASAAVDNARLAQSEALLAQREKAAQAALKQAQLEQEYDDLRRKAAKNARDDASAREKDENAVKEAIIARGEAEQKAAQLALTNIASIRDTLDAVAKGNKDVAGQVNLAEVSVQNLTKAIIAQAGESSKGLKPDGYQTLIALSRTLSQATNEQISQDQRLALVNRLAGTSMTALGASAAEILHVLENDTAQLEKFNEVTKALDTKEAKAAINDFRGALAGLNLDISILSQRFAIAISPAFTAFLKAIQSSIEDNNGLIHNFVSGIGQIGSSLSDIGGALRSAIDLFGSFFNIKTNDVLKAAIIGVGVALLALTGPIGVVIVAITLVSTAIGAIKDHWPEIEAAAKKAWDSVKDNAVVKFFVGVLEVVLKIIQGLAAIDKFTGIKTGSKSDSTAPAQQPSLTEGHATGGPIRGPGSGTSDSILARLSNGEFVMKTAAVQAYGESFFHSLNNMQIPGFAGGGMVDQSSGSGARPSVGSKKAEAYSVLNLTVGDRTFSGLKGPKSTIDDLSHYAIARQTSAAGSNPSWMK